MSEASVWRNAVSHRDSVWDTVALGLLHRHELFPPYSPICSLSACSLLTNVLTVSRADGAKPVDLVDGAKRVESARGTIQARERALWADSLLRAQNSLQVNQTIRDELSAQDAAAFLELVRNEKVQDLAEEGWHLAPPGLSCQER